MVIVQNKFNELNEAIFFLHSIAENINYEELKKDAKDSCFGETIYLNMLGTLKDLQSTIKNSLEVSKDKLDFYFRPINENDLCIVDFIMQYDYINYNETLEENLVRVKSLSDSDRLLEYAKLILEYHTQGNLEDVDQISNLSDLINTLEKSDLSDESKMAILNTFCNKDKYQEEVVEIISKTILILKENHSQYQYIEDFAYHYWTQYFSSNDIREIIEKKSNVEWNYNPNGIIIQPILSYPSRTSISIPDEEGKMDVVRIGILIDEKFKQRKKAVSIEDITNIMKVFGDKSKLDIMNLIKDQSAYGKELADTLGLAKGTISHHMSSLMSIGIIDTVCESNRIYYKLNKNRIGEIFDELKDYFV